MREQLLPGGGVHEDKPAEEKRRKLKTDHSGWQLPEKVRKGEEEGFPFWRRVKWEISEKGDHSEVGLLEIWLSKNCGQTWKPTHIRQEHLCSSEFPERRRFPVRALGQQLGDEQAGRLHILGSLLLLQLEPLEALHPGKPPPAVWRHKDGSQPEAAVAAAGDVVQELESLKHVLEAEAECLVCLLPSHHRQRGGFLCEEMRFGRSGKPGDVSQYSGVTMLGKVFGEKLDPSTFAELIVDEHGKLALVSLLPLQRRKFQRIHSKGKRDLFN